MSAARPSGAQRARHRGRRLRRHVRRLLALPEHLRDALWKVESRARAVGRPGGLIVAGMGGSAIGGALARAALGDRASRPILAAARLRAAAVDDARHDRCSAPATRATPRRRSPATRRPARSAPAASSSPPAARWPSGARRGRAGDPGRRRLPAARRGAYMMSRARGRRAVRAGPRMHSEIDVAADAPGGAGRRWGPDGADDAWRSARPRAPRDVSRSIAGAGLTAPIAVPLEDPAQRERQGPGFATSCPSWTTTRSCGWAGAAASSGRFPRSSSTTRDLHPRVRQRMELTRRADRAGAAAVVPRRRRAARRASSASSRSSCSATSSRSTSRCCGGSTRRPSTRSSASRRS